MRHLVRHCLRGSLVIVSGLAIAACSGLYNMPDVRDAFDAGAVNKAAPGEISGVNAVRMRVAGKAMEKGDHEVAARFYQAVADAVPASADPLVGLGEAELARGRLDEAETAFRAAVLLSPVAAAPNDGLGRVLVSKGAFLEAVQHFRRALAEAPSAALHNKLGVAHDLMGDGEAAQQHYRAALEIDPETATARNNLALSLAISERYPEAVAEMERVAAGPDATPRHRQNLAFIYGMAGRLQDTAKVLGETGVSPSEHERNRALFERIRALAKAGDRSAVLEVLRSAKPGSSFAGQMDSIPAVATDRAPERGLRPDEMAIASPSKPAAETPAIAAVPEPAAEPTAEPAAGPEPATTPEMASQPDPAAVPLPDDAAPAEIASSSEQASPAPEPRQPAETEMARLAPAEQPPEPAEKAAEAAASVADATAGAQYRVQLASYRTERAVLRGRKMLLGMLGERVADIEALVRQSRDGAGGIDYRLRTRSLTDREAGGQLCIDIAAAGHPDCLVIQHNAALWQPVADPAPAPAMAAADAQYRIQLASYRTEKHAVRGRAILSQLLGERVRDLEILVKRSHADTARSIDFTIRTAPLESAEQAALLCEAVRAAGHPGCLVIQHSDAFWQIAGAGGGTGGDPGGAATATAN